MITQQRHQEALTNNLANVNTPGYKADQATMRSFPELLIRQMGSRQVPTTQGLNMHTNRPVGSLHTGVYVKEMVPNFSQGPLKETGLITDMALIDGQLPDETGGLFFTVQNEVGEERYTRNGHFTVDGSGFLVTNEGYYVLDETGNPIYTDGLDFNVTPEGDLQVNGQTYRLGIAYIENVNELVKEGQDMYNGAEAGVQALNPLQAGATYTVNQRVLERSNVDSMQTMSQMMQAYRVFEANQRVLKMYDDSMQKAVNEIGKLG